MSVLTWVGGMALTAVLLVCAVVADAYLEMAKRDAQTRVQRLPSRLLRMAAGLQSQDVAAVRREEWEAELREIVADAEALPLTCHLRALRYAVGLLWASGRIRAPDLVAGLGATGLRLISVGTAAYAAAEVGVLAAPWLVVLAATASCLMVWATALTWMRNADDADWRPVGRRSQPGGPTTRSR